MTVSKVSPHSIAAFLSELPDVDPHLFARLGAIKSFSRQVRASEYHITTACNIRCKGCWFFEYDFDTETKDNKSVAELREFIAKERDRGVNTALLIGGEPTLFPDRVAAYVEGMPYVSVSTNGLRALPRSGFERTNVFVTLFGGGKLDDELRAIKPGGRRFTGLFDTALENYRNDDRALFVFAITESGIENIDETVRRIRDNGNRVHFNFYSEYGSKSILRLDKSRALMEEALRVRALYPDTVISTPFYIQTMITGQTDWAHFGYDVCPSISIDHPAHAERLANGHRSLPLFNAYAPDLKTVNFCCTSGHCDGCRDSQAVFSWLMVSSNQFMTSVERARTWVELAESYWSQFIWAPFHPALARQGRDRSPPSARRSNPAHAADV